MEFGGTDTAHTQAMMLITWASHGNYSRPNKNKRNCNSIIDKLSVHDIHLLCVRISGSTLRGDDGSGSAHVNTTTVVDRRERPFLVLDHNHMPLYLITGVQTDYNSHTPQGCRSYTVLTHIGPSGRAPRRARRLSTEHWATINELKKWSTCTDSAFGSHSAHGTLHINFIYWNLRR